MTVFFNIKLEDLTNKQQCFFSHKFIKLKTLFLVAKPDIMKIEPGAQYVLPLFPFLARQWPNE